MRRREFAAAVLGAAAAEAVAVHMGADADPTDRPLFRPGTRGIERNGSEYVYGRNRSGKYEWFCIDEPTVDLN